MDNKALGQLGEKKACKMLIQLGHHILFRNFRFQRGEIDIISIYEGRIHFTEVKTRQTAAVGEPWQAVTRAKQRQIIKVADAYLKLHGIDLDAQFNIASIVHNQYRSDITYIPDAFLP